MLTILNSLIKRILAASVLWALAWPVVYYFKMGEITGAKAWFWIIGELNYPVALIAYVLLDNIFTRFGLKPYTTFFAAAAIVAACTPFYFKHYGFVLGVSLEARIF